jgi:hypothetical protein
VKVQALVDRQAEDKRLWRDGLIADALHLQIELRRLHEGVNLATESAATTPPDGGLEEVQDALEDRILEERQQITSVLVGGLEEARDLVEAAGSHRDAATDQSPETDPSPSQGEGGGVR